MDAEQEKVLIASIERKMDNVLQSVRSRHGVDGAGRKSAEGRHDVLSPVTAGAGMLSTSSVPGASSASSVVPASCASSCEGTTAEQMAGRTPGEATRNGGLGFSMDEFQEEFSDGSDAEALHTGLPVDSMVNFPAAADVAAVNRKGSAMKKERGHISAHGATEDGGRGVGKRRSRGKQQQGDGQNTPKKTPSFAEKLVRKITQGFRSPRASRHEPSEEK